MKKVLIVSTVSRQFYLFEQVNIEILKEMGYEVHAAANFSDRNERLDKLGIIEHPIDIQRSPFALKNIVAYKQLYNLMKEQEFDLVHCHSPVGGVLARLAAKKANIKKVIYTAHGFHFCKGAPLINWLLFYPIERWLSRYTNTLITINREDYKRAKSFKSCKVEYVPGIGIDTVGYGSCTVDRAAKRKELGISDEDIVILSVGELSKRKNHQAVIKSLASVKSDNIKYILCGTGKKDKLLKSLTKKNGLENKIIFLGFRNDIAEIMASSDIFVMPSLREGLPVAMMEAMACGLPIVCSNIRGHTDLIKNNKGGFLVAAGDEDGYAKALEKLVEDKNLRLSFGAFNKKRVKHNDRHIIKRKMKDIYINVQNIDSNKGKRISFLIGSMRCGGAERVISILANSYSDSGWQVDILMLLDNQCAYKLRDNIRLIDISNGSKSRILYLPVWILKIRKYIKTVRPDKIVSFIGRINVIALMAGLGLGTDIIISERSNPMKDGRSLIAKIASYILYPRAKTIIFQTRAVQNCFPAYIREKGVIIANPVEVMMQACPNRSKKIVSAGRLSREKNHRMLIKAFSKIKAEHPDYCLYIYGEGPVRAELEKQIKRLKLSDTVFLPGVVENLHEQISDAEIFVLCSDYEGQSNALIEAMMMGLACISTRYEGVTELIQHGKNGLLVNTGDDEQLYRMINILIKDKEKALLLGRQGQKSVEYMKLENCLPVWRSCIEK